MGRGRRRVIITEEKATKGKITKKTKEKEEILKRARDMKERAIKMKNLLLERRTKKAEDYLVKKEGWSRKATESGVEHFTKRVDLTRNPLGEAANLLSKKAIFEIMARAKKKK